MAYKLTGTNQQGATVEVFVYGPAIYDEGWQATVDPGTLQVGDQARTHYLEPSITLTLAPEVI